MPPSQTDHTHLQLYQHVFYCTLSSITQGRVKLEHQLRILNAKYTSIQTLLHNTHTCTIQPPGANYQLQYQPAPYGHPLPFSSLATSRNSINHVHFVAYEADGYGSDPKTNMCCNTGSARGDRPQRTLPHVRYVGQQRYYHASIPAPAQRCTGAEVDINHDSLAHHMH